MPLKTKKVVKKKDKGNEKVEKALKDAANSIPPMPKIYQVPVTKEDYLALHKCLKDSGINSIGDLEVKASKL